MENILESLKMHTTRESTAKNYFNIWTNFNKFIVKLDKKPTTWERRVALYGAYLVQSGAQSATVKSYFSAIKKILYSTISYKLSEDTMLLNSIAKACKLVNDRVTTRLPISCKTKTRVFYFDDESTPFCDAVLLLTFINMAQYAPWFAKGILLQYSRS